MYLAFVSFVLPAVIKDVEAGKPLTIGDTAEASMDFLGIEEEEETDSVPDTELVELENSFKRMENEIITLRNDLVERVELAISNSRQTDTPQLETRINNLEDLLKETIEQNKTLTYSLEKLNAALDKTGERVGNCSNIDSEKVDIIARSLSALKYDIAKTGTIYILVSLAIL